MNERFLRYIRSKGLSQNKIADLSCLAASVVNRFCRGASISSDNLLRILQVCDDLSLEWFFFGTGDMIKKHDMININMSPFAGADIANGHATVVHGSSRVKVSEEAAARDFLAELAAKDRVIAERDAVIQERDRTISELNSLLLKAQRSLND